MRFGANGSGKCKCPSIAAMFIKDIAPLSYQSNHSASGLVVKSIVAIDGPRVRFAAGAKILLFFGLFFHLVILTIMLFLSFALFHLPPPFYKLTQLDIQTIFITPFVIIITPCVSCAALTRDGILDPSPFFHAWIRRVNGRHSTFGTFI